MGLVPELISPGAVHAGRPLDFATGPERLGTGRPPWAAKSSCNLKKINIHYFDTMT